MLKNNKNNIEQIDNDIAALKDIIVELVDPDKIILFGS